MSRDIRSFFVVKNSKSGQQKIDLSTKKSLQKPVEKKKRPIIIDSDSDEESSSVNNKRSKPSIEGKKLDSKKSPVCETKSKYFECPISDIFCNTPVKRNSSRKIIKRVISKENKESHFDKDFEAELANLDDIWSEKTSDEPLKIVKSEENKVDGGNLLSSIKSSPKKTDAQVADYNTGKSPRKKNSDVDFSESPKKKLKLEHKEGFSTKLDRNKDDKLPVLNGHRNESPRKNAASCIYSPDKSPKSSLSNKGKTKTPEKSPYKDSTILRKEIESIKHHKLNCDSSNSSTSKTEDTSFPSLGKESPKTIVNRFPNETSHVVKNKKHPTINKVSGTTKKNDESIINKNCDKFEKKESSATVRAEEKPVTTSSVPSNLWVERYKPTSTKQIIGQQGEKSCVNKLITWLNNWEKNQSGAKKLVKPSPWAKNDDGAFFKAALLSGPPGVGKTTTAHLVCKELGFDVVEFNASDTRSKKLLHEEVSELLSTKSLSPFFTGKNDQVTKKHVLLMDEVDGMAGNEDRGGVQELISLIKQSRIPVICMCNDRNHPKIRSLANYCFDLRFSKPRVEQIRGAMMSVCFKEKLKLKPDELADIITSANQDIRLVMNHLSMLALEKSSLANSTKHIKLGPWDIVRKIFSEQDHKSMSIYDKCDLFFHDYSITPLFVQENYLNAVPHKPEAKDKIKKMELFAKAATSLSFGDLTEKSIRSNNAWGLLPVQAIFSSLVPGDVLEGHLGAQINFPAWFGKNSRQTKMSRLVQELTVHSRLKISGNREAMNLDYLTSLGSAITSPLLHDGVDGVPTALAVLSEYCLVREDMESLAELSTWPGCQNRFAQVDSKVKAAFTRAYNKTSAPTPYAAVPIKKGRGDVDTSDGLGEEEELESQDVEDEEEEGLESDAMIMVKKKPTGKKADKDVQPSTSKGGKTSKRGRKK